MNLHDWIDELCDVLELEDVEVDEGLLADVSKTSAENVERLAAPVTAYLLGYAAGAQEAGPAQVEALAARAQELAEGWDRPAGARDDVADPPADDGDEDYRGDLDLGDDGNSDDTEDEPAADERVAR